MIDRSQFYRGFVAEHDDLPVADDELGFRDVRAVRGDGEPSQPDDPAFVFVATKPGA